MIKWLLLCFLLVSSSYLKAQPSHEIFDQLLIKHVSIDGKVNYRGFISDSSRLNTYLMTLSSTPPKSNWSKEDELAYWINVYNAFTIKLITNYYPVKSIKEIGSSIQIPFVNSPWDIRFIRIGNEKLDLNTIEHVKIRKKFKDPRIHMVLVCASKSCPALLNRAYTAQNINNQLDIQARKFLSDPFRNNINPLTPKMSMIFSWYSGDFMINGGSVISFINQFSAIKVRKNAKIEYLEYDWSLNE